MRAAALLLGAIVALGALEILARIVVAAYPDPWRVSKDDPRHYYRASDNPALAYELAPGTYERGDLRLVVNRYGIRHDSDDLSAGVRRIALLGDSSTFGTWHSQENTIAAEVRKLLLNEQVQVFNLGVPGYGIAEVAEHFKDKNAVYNFDDALYLLNLNDFARRDSVYEGADNGLYRMYRPARWATLHILRKAYYRWKKHGHLADSNETSEGWYRWLYEGNRDFARRQLERMALYARDRRIRFGVVILPVGSAFDPGGEYRLANLTGDLKEMLNELGIEFIDPASRFAANRAELIEETEHPTATGNRLLAQVIAPWILRSKESHHR